VKKTNKKMVSARHRKVKQLKVLVDGRSDRVPMFPRLGTPRPSFGLIPVTSPYEESDPELRVLNAVVKGLVYEGSFSSVAGEVALSRVKFQRVLKSLMEKGKIYVNGNGKYQLAFGVSNFPNLVDRER
jgi:hypothetical protein